MVSKCPFLHDFHTWTYISKKIWKYFHKKQFDILVIFEYMRYSSCPSTWRFLFISLLLLLIYFCPFGNSLCSFSIGRKVSKKNYFVTGLNVVSAIIFLFLKIQNTYNRYIDILKERFLNYGSRPQMGGAKRIVGVAKI